ncbi:hypothetical protein [Leptolyngbya sp. FACHB-261]|uniref:hypothetical protein n=1 Tax=Leptolyngbya sp. FACHB-261 TaxID=2692806 RepID=UPI00168595C3|nr:hypothetical protein [Leptolyngbya sp. FACHB-261]MBD2104694.1 hypothetical protein [Leptolyngbya sp. FACHB-261]
MKLSIRIAALPITSVLLLAASISPAFARDGYRLGTVNQRVTDTQANGVSDDPATATASGRVNTNRNRNEASTTTNTSTTSTEDSTGANTADSNTTESSTVTTAQDGSTTDASVERSNTVIERRTQTTTTTVEPAAQPAPVSRPAPTYEDTRTEPAAVRALW